MREARALSRVEFVSVDKSMEPRQVESMEEGEYLVQIAATAWLEEASLMVNSPDRGRQRAAREPPGGADQGDWAYEGAILVGDELVTATAKGIRYATC